MNLLDNAPRVIDGAAVFLDHARDDRRQRSLHARHHDQHAGRAQHVERGEQAVQPGDADVAEQLDRVAEASRHQRRFRRDGQVGRARAHHGDRAAADDLHLLAPVHQDARELVVAAAGQASLHLDRGRGVDARHQHVLTRRVQHFDDLGDLRRSLPGPEHHLG